MRYNPRRRDFYKMEINKSQGDVLISQMDIPKSLKETIFNAALISIVVFFVLLAVANLLLFNYLPLITLILSLIWLVFVFFQVRRSCREDGGVKQFMIKLAGVFAPSQFAEIVQNDRRRKALYFGYRLFGNRFYYLKIQSDGIKTIDWEMGQASSLAGRDMNDWQVVIWFDADLATTLNWTPSDRPRFGLHIVGPSRENGKLKNLATFLLSFCVILISLRHNMMTWSCRAWLAHLV